MTRRQLVEISDNGTFSIGNVSQVKQGFPGEGTIFLAGDFDDGTGTLQMRCDNNGTWEDVPNQLLTATKFTASVRAISYRMCTDSRNPVQLAVTLAGATTPAITVYHFDSR